MIHDYTSPHGYGIHSDCVHHFALSRTLSFQLTHTYRSHHILAAYTLILRGLPDKAIVAIQNGSNAQNSVTVVRLWTIIIQWSQQIITIAIVIFIHTFWVPWGFIYTLQVVLYYNYTHCYWISCTWCVDKPGFYLVRGGGGDSPQTLQLPPWKSNFKFKWRVVS